MKIVFATGNRGKLREAREIFKGFEIVSIEEFPNWRPPKETGETFLQNALLKAEAAMKIVKDCAVLADDSGLVALALNGAPGVYSSRFAAEGDDSLNRQKLLKELKGKKERGAYFSTAAFLMFPDGFALAASGECRGKIIDCERGENGFGYDPLFVPDNREQTLAELGNEEKNGLSHRGKAFRVLIAKLRQGLSGGDYFCGFNQ